MKQKIYKQIRVVQNKDPDQFQREFNEIQKELSHLKPETIYDISADGYKAIIQYEVEVEEPETAQDEMSIQGFSFVCRECPKFKPVLNNDGSIRKTRKRGSCFLQERCWADSLACEWACKAYLRGELEVLK